jgi:hypothetical protein
LQKKSEATGFGNERQYPQVFETILISPFLTCDREFNERYCSIKKRKRAVVIQGEDDKSPKDDSSRL